MFVTRYKVHIVLTFPSPHAIEHKYDFTHGDGGFPQQFF